MREKQPDGFTKMLALTVERKQVYSGYFTLCQQYWAKSLERHGVAKQTNMAIFTVELGLKCGSILGLCLKIESKDLQRGKEESLSCVYQFCKGVSLHLDSVKLGRQLQLYSSVFISDETTLLLIGNYSHRRDLAGPAGGLNGVRSLKHHTLRKT